MVRLDGPTRALVQRMLAVAAREGVAAPDAAAGNVPGTGPRHVMNVREAVRAAAESLCRSLRRRRTVAGRDVADLLDEASRLLPRALPVVESKRILEELADSIDAHLRDAFAGERPAAAAPNRSAARLPRDAGPAEDDLAHAIRLFTAGARQFDAVVGPDVVEEFSIILQIRSAGGAAPDAAHVERRVAAAAASGLDEAGIAVLTAWVREACARTDAADFDALVAPVVAGLRRTEPFAFARAVLDAHHRGCREAAVIAWPYLAGVLLSANRSVDAPLREELATVLAEVPASRVRYEAERLEGLLEPTDGGTAPVVLSTPRAQLFPIYNVLFGLPAETGYPRVVLASFAKHAAAYPSMGALVNLPAGDERARRLLQQILRDGGDREGTRALAVEILVSRLRALPADGRDAPWIVSAVKSLGALPCSESAEFLEEVLRRRRWVIGWAWPESIRSVAAQARVAGDYRARMRSSSGVPV
jgi:hypothetical protein